jgi:hypothetical protein
MMHAPWSVGTRAEGGGELRPAIISFLAALAIALALPVGTACLPDRAKIPVVPPAVLDGACCGLQNGVCTVLTSANCQGLGSAYQYRGDGALCLPNPCSIPSLSGACCSRQDGACTVLTPANCQGQGGGYLYSGDGTVCSPSPCPPVLPAGAFIASGRVTSLQAGTIKTTSGAMLVVPKFSVPRTPAGGEGTMAFSIERDPMSITPPTGRNQASDIYRIGPDGFVLSRPVRLTLPVLGDTTNKSFVLYRINQTTGNSEPYGGTFDKDSLTLSVQTYRFSPWYVGSAPRANTAWGAIEVTNSSLDQWLNLCVEEYNVKYPDADADFRGEASSSWAPVGEIGVTNHGLWFVPQGTYRLCAEMRRAGTISSPPGPAHHVLLNNIQVNEAWTYAQPRTTPLNLSDLGAAALDSTCACSPVATPSVGTGDVQVTLTWHSAQAVDLDLWVTEPGGTQCYYGNTPTSTGGTLDIDNKCGNYVDGRPENIFWANAPAGDYKVEVKWFGNCGTGVTSLGYDLRLINGGTARTFTGTITPSPSTVEVTRFTVTAGRPVRFLPVGEPPASPGPMPPKE